MSRSRAVALLVRVSDSIESTVRQARAGSRTREPPDACGFQPTWSASFWPARSSASQPSRLWMDSALRLARCATDRAGQSAEVRKTGQPISVCQAVVSSVSRGPTW
jgi:hypothetical protein